MTKKEFRILNSSTGEVFQSYGLCGSPPIFSGRKNVKGIRFKTKKGAQHFIDECISLRKFYENEPEYAFDKAIVQQTSLLDVYKWTIEEVARPPKKKYVIVNNAGEKLIRSKYYIDPPKFSSRSNVKGWMFGKRSSAEDYIKYIARNGTATSQLKIEEIEV